MASQTFSRRWFLRATATATVALVTARVLPVEAIPRSGDLYQVLHADAITRLRRAYHTHLQAFGHPPRCFHVGPALEAAYEGELHAHQRVVSSMDAYPDVVLAFKGTPVLATLTSPWAITAVAR